MPPSSVLTTPSLCFIICATSTVTPLTTTMATRRSARWPGAWLGGLRSGDDDCGVPGGSGTRAPAPLPRFVGRPVCRSGCRLRLSPARRPRCGDNDTSELSVLNMLTHPPHRIPAIELPPTDASGITGRHPRDRFFDVCLETERYMHPDTGP